MKLPELSVRRPVAVSMFFLAVIILSLVSLSRLSIDIFPEITFPAITISTSYLGAGPEDVENKVTKLIESFVGIVPDLKEVSSISKENISVVTLRFGWGKNLDEAANDVRARLEFAKRFLPTGVDQPVLLKFDLSQAPIMFLSASAKQNYGRITNILNDQVAEPLKRVQGVGNVFIFGGPVREIRVDVDKNRLKAYGISLSQIVSALAANNITQPAGDLDIGSQSFFLRVPAEFKTIEDIKNVMVGYYQGIPVFLYNVAYVKDDYERPTIISRQEKEKSAFLIVQKRSGANTVQVSDGVLKVIEEIKKGLPPDVNLRVAFNLADNVKKTIDNLTNTVWIGGILVVLVTYLFIFSVRSSLVIFVSIPVSLIVAFLFLYIFGYTINIMSLSSLAIAIGMVVDNAIVVLENIIRHKNELNENIVEASINGASEVGLAVSASTLTTVVVFLPLIFTQGFVGIFFKQLGAVISITLLVSLAISLTLSPMIASKLLGGADSDISKKIRNNIINKLFEAGFGKVRDFFHNLLNKSLSRRKKTVFFASLIFVVSLFIIRFVGVELLPDQDAGFIQALIKLPVNTSLFRADEFSLKFIDIAQKILGNDRELIFSRAGQSTFGGGFEQEGANIISLQATLVDKRKRRSDKVLAQLLRESFRKIPGPIQIDFITGDPSQRRFAGGDKPLLIEILGYDFTTTDLLADRIKKIVSQTEGTVDVTVSRERGKLEYQLIVDRPKLASLGISPNFIADTINIAFNGRVATKFRDGKDEYNILVKLRDEDRKDIKDVLDLSVKLPDGRSFLLRDLTQLKLSQGPLTIERKDQQRIVKVSANVFGRSIGEVSADIQKEIKKIALPPGIVVNFGGTVKEIREDFSYLLLALLLGFILTYMVMAAQFESFRDPFIIIFSVPFAIVGSIWGLFITRQTLNIASFIGLIMLVGIVVNNAIVFIDYTIQLRSRNKGIKVSDALLEAQRVRLRPILMTTLTTVFGMLPLALSTGQGSEVWRPLAVTIIFGLTFSTFITLIFIPVLYSIFEERIKRF